MKKILFMFIAVLMFVLGGCSSAKEIDDFEKVDKVLDSLSSYSLTAEMTIYKTEKEIKANITVDYLQPNYYKVCFSTANGHEQIIIKNNDGVFVLTPSLNKQFKFDSEWPINSSHAYLVDALWDDIKKDTSMTYEVNNNVMTITASLNSSNSKFSKLKMYINISDTAPTKVELFDNNNTLKVSVNVKSFTANPKLNASLFNQASIMDEKSNVGEGETPESTAAITVGYVCDDTTLQSQKTTDECTVLCYGGAKNYTIIAKKISLEDDITVSSFSSYELLDNGFVFYSDTVSKYYVGDIEISVYSKVLTIEEVSQILSEIVTV